MRHSSNNLQMELNVGCSLLHLEERLKGGSSDYRKILFAALKIFARNSPTNFDILIERASEFINVEEAQVARRKDITTSMSVPNVACPVEPFQLPKGPRTDLHHHHPEPQPQTIQHIDAPTHFPQRVLQDVPILVMVSMLAYFCFLEQLLVSELGPQALAVSLPFSCVLGLLASMIASTMVSQSYIWSYASFQFALVILFAHVFYSVLGVSPVFYILLSSFTGFGISISMNSLLIEYLRWRARRTLRSVQLNQSQQQNEARNLAGVEDGDDTRQQDLENQIQDPNPLQHGQNHS
ncbi:uncharacterized protein LOC122011079 [Zingiber officinale]|uniref:uncharacterized protein LOC122011079 n=1 Tax=Zingiber officinale TaxID=94328 RepID=UPI001C4A7DEA|nr:uncharacterized protein LOC122011079 [Zingiber officinale]